MSHHHPRTPPGFALREDLVKIVVHHFGKDSVAALQTAHTAWRRIESQDIATPDMLVNFFVEPEEWISTATDACTSLFPNTLSAKSKGAFPWSMAHVPQPVGYPARAVRCVLFAVPADRIGKTEIKAAPARNVSCERGFCRKQSPKRGFFCKRRPCNKRSGAMDTNPENRPATRS